MSKDTDLKPKPLSADDHEFLAYLEQNWLIHGALPTREACVENTRFDERFVKRCITNPNFRHALVARGISLNGFSLVEGTSDGVLTEEQLVVANTMLDLRDNRSQTKKLRELGVSTAKWEGWLRDPAFQSYLRTRAENLLGDNLHESHLALLDRVRSGDINAIKYFNEITGRYVPNGNDKADVNSVLMMVLEVIQRRVRDPEVLSAISDDLVAIGRRTSNGFGGGFGGGIINATPVYSSLPVGASPNTTTSPKSEPEVYDISTAEF